METKDDDCDCACHNPNYLLSIPCSKCENYHYVKSIRKSVEEKNNE